MTIQEEVLFLLSSLFLSLFSLSIFTIVEEFFVETFSFFTPSLLLLPLTSNDIIAYQLQANIYLFLIQNDFSER